MKFASRLLFIVSFLLSLNSITATAQTTLSDVQMMAIHDRMLTIDSHTDIGPGFGTAKLDPSILNNAQVNLPSMRIGGLDASFFIVFTPQAGLTEKGLSKAKEIAEEKYRNIMRMIRANSHIMGLATSTEEAQSLNAEGKLIALIGVENSYPFGFSSNEVHDAVKIWAERGARYASITHFGHNQFGGSSNPSKRREDGDDPGLTELGKTLISALNDYGIMVDVSHVGPKTTADAISASRAPVIASHSTVKAVYDNPRGLSDEQLMAIRHSGGVAQITAYRSYIAGINPKVTAAVKTLRERLGLTSYAAYITAPSQTIAEFQTARNNIRKEYGDVTLDQFLNHLDHAINVVGIDHVGISGDFDGGGGVRGWDGAADSSNVTFELLKRGYTEQDIAKIWGGNLLRVMRDVQKMATK